MRRRLEDRIRELSTRIVTADNVGEIQTLSVQLQSSIREYISRMRRKLSLYPSAKDRRSTSSGQTDDKSVA